MAQVHSGSPQAIGGAEIAANVAAVRAYIAAACESAGRRPEAVTLVAVSKTFPPHLIESAFAAGVTDFGENWVQEAAEKIPTLRHLRATWHMVGHLQTNKAKAALDLFDVIQSVDSLHLAEAIAKRAGKQIRVLLEVNVAGEPSKQGFAPHEVPAAVKAIGSLPELDLRGLMTVAPETDDPEQTRPVFRKLKLLADEAGLPELSMGMSADYPVAIQEGATIARIGRAIFGQRPRNP